MKKRLLAVLMSVAMLGCMTACGSDSAEKTDKKDTDKKTESSSDILVGFSQVGAESDWRTANT